jgi:hypothetical protein
MTTEARCSCQHCDGHIEFPSEMDGQAINCPHCTSPTVLNDPTAPLPKGFAPRMDEIPETWKIVPKKRNFNLQIFLWYFGFSVVFAFLGYIMADTRPSILAAIGGGFGTAGLLFLAGLIYFAPSIVAHQNRKRNANAIFILNFFLGWTLIGWVVALVWVNTVEK